MDDNAMEGTIIPTYPMTGMGNNGFFGGDGIGALLIGALLFGGGLWGNNRGVGAAAAVDPYVGLSQQIQTLSGQINANAVTDQLGTLSSNLNAFQLAALNANATTNQAICSGFGSVNNNICNSTHALENAINQGNFNLLNGMTNGFNNVVLQNTNSTNQILQAINGVTAKMDANTIVQLAADKASLSAQLADAIQTGTITSQFCDLKQQLASCCCNQGQTMNTLNANLNNLSTTMTGMEGAALTRLNDIIDLLTKK